MTINMPRQKTGIYYDKKDKQESQTCLNVILSDRKRNKNLS